MNEVQIIINLDDDTHVTWTGKTKDITETMETLKGKYVTWTTMIATVTKAQSSMVLTVSKNK